MKILPINNTNTQNTQFKAKFPKQDVKQFLTEIEDCDCCVVPQLYTLLDFVKNLSGKTAEIVPSRPRPFYQIHIDGKSITNGQEYISAFHALYNAIVSHEKSSLKTSPLKRMTEDQFEINYFKNANKTTKDIEKIFD